MKPKSGLTFGEGCKQNAVMVCLLLLAQADENGILDVTSDTSQHLDAGVHFTLKETEQRVTNVLNGTLHRCQGLHVTNDK